MLIRIFPNLTKRLVNRVVSSIYIKDNKCHYYHTVNTHTNITLCKQYPTDLSLIKRYKSKKQKKAKQNEPEDSDGEEEEEETDDSATPGSKVMNLAVISLRLDVILKASLSMARSKIENAFYEGKIRINGQKVLKKSSEIAIGDEIDFIRGRSIENPDFLVVSRVVLLSADVTNNGYKIKVARDKTLMIENYEDKWQGSAE